MMTMVMATIMITRMAIMMIMMIMTIIVIPLMTINESINMMIIACSLNINISRKAILYQKIGCCLNFFGSEEK